MKTRKILSNHIIIYDDECPLCNVYTSGFVKFKFLDSDSRLPYSKIHKLEIPELDDTRSKNEIPLLNTKTGTVDYGATSLLKILGNRWKVFLYLSQCVPLLWLIKKLYSFISFNRKVIVPGNPSASACNPTFSLKYRFLYLLFCWIVVATVLYLFNPLIKGIVPATNFYFELMIAGGQLVFQGIFMIGKSKEIFINYLGHLMTVSLLGAIGLLPLLLINLFITLNPILNLACFLVIAGLMFLEHWRRVKLLNLSSWLCISWALYRILIVTTLI